MLPPNAIIPFDGNHADIPAGFTRETNFDGRFPKGTSSSWGTTGGSDTHTHTATHTHTIEPHTHHFSVMAARDIASTHDMGPSGGQVEYNHSHYGNAYTAGTGTQTSGSTAANLVSSTLNSVPPYYEVIFIKSVGYSLIPINGMVFSVGSRAGMTFHSASANKFLRGAATAADAGGTGGASTHYHTQTHTHTANPHSHSYGYTQSDTGRGEDGMSSPGLAGGGHGHTFGVSTATQNMNSDSTNSSTSSTIPYNKTIQHYKASSNIIVRVGDIVMTTETTNPIGWITCDGTDGTPDLVGFYIQNNATAGTVSGSNTHNHTVTHGHTASGTHYHNHDQYSSYTTTIGGHNGSGRTGLTNHRHEIYNPGSTAANYSSTVATSTTESNEPAYIQVKFIQATQTAIFFGAPLVALL